jgi:hypothetical protein
MKLFTKVMVNRLHPCIPTLVDPDQTLFIHGQSIAENIVYAATSSVATTNVELQLRFSN